MPLVNVNHFRFVPVKREASAGQWPPVCSSVHWQARNTGTSIRLTKVIGDSGSTTLGAVVVVAPDLRDQVDRLRVQVLVLPACLVAPLDPAPRPRLPRGRPGGLGVVHPVLRPLRGEARVEDPAGIERRQRAVDHRQRCDRGEAGRPGRGDEQLADAAVGDPEHADPVVERPGLPGDRLDHVVAVERLQALEVVERASRATGAAHVHVHDRPAEQGCNRLDAALRAGRVGVAVAGVLDEGRVGAVLRADRAGGR